MRIPLYFFLLFIVITIRGQVGINTKLPETTLDVVGKPTDVNHYDGIIPPRIAGDLLAAKTYTSAKEGTIVFVISPATNLIGQVMYVVKSGLYIFDGNVWQPVSKQKQTIEYQIILRFDHTSEEGLTATSEWSESVDLSGNNNSYPTSSKFYSIGTKKLGGLQGMITFRKIDWTVNMRMQTYRDSNSTTTSENVTIDISEICDDIGYNPNTVLFMQTENETYGIMALVRNKSIYIPALYINQISTKTIGELQGYSNWIRPR